MYGTQSSLTILIYPYTLLVPPKHENLLFGIKNFRLPNTFNDFNNALAQALNVILFSTFVTLYYFPKIYTKIIYILKYL